MAAGDYIVDRNTSKDLPGSALPGDLHGAQEKDAPACTFNQCSHAFVTWSYQGLGVHTGDDPLYRDTGDLLFQPLKFIIC